MTTDGKITILTLKANVIGYESVTVPAGTFLAFKTIISANGQRFRESWYAPDAKAVVRSIQYDSGGKGVVGELLEYSRTDDTPAKSE